MAPGPAPGPSPLPEGWASDDLQDLEIGLLLEGVFLHYGYDFRDYALSSLRRRIRQSLQEEKLATVSALQERVLHDPAALERLVFTLSVNVTSLFRHPGFYRAFRERAVPILRTYPVVRVWHAGCATGEEVYSLAILLWEEGLYERSRIYATDMNSSALRRATAGRFPLPSVREGVANYMLAGGPGSLAEFHSVREGQAVFSDALKRNIVFAQHNLVTDRSFNEFNVILCRNVLIYFNRHLQERVHGLLYDSLARRGFLGLGNRESVQFTAYDARYEVVDWPDRLYRKVA